MVYLLASSLFVAIGGALFWLGRPRNEPSPHSLMSLGLDALPVPAAVFAHFNYRCAEANTLWKRRVAPMLRHGDAPLLRQLTELLDETAKIKDEGGSEMPQTISQTWDALELTTKIVARRPKDEEDLILVVAVDRGARAQMDTTLRDLAHDAGKWWPWVETFLFAVCDEGADATVLRNVEKRKRVRDFGMALSKAIKPLELILADETTPEQTTLGHFVRQLSKELPGLHSPPTYAEPALETAIVEIRTADMLRVFAHLWDNAQRHGDSTEARLFIKATAPAPTETRWVDLFFIDNGRGFEKGAVDPVIEHRKVDRPNPAEIRSRGLGWGIRISRLYTTQNGGELELVRPNRQGEDLRFDPANPDRPGACIRVSLPLVEMV